MTYALISWLGRLRSISGLPAPAPQSTEPDRMKIEVEHRPDYLWRGLGFQQPRHRADR